MIMFRVVRVDYFFFQWFREIGWKDQDAVLQFPTNLEKPQRKQVHEIAQSFGLGTSSSGFGETVRTFYILSIFLIRSVLNYTCRCVQLILFRNNFVRGYTM